MVVIEELLPEEIEANWNRFISMIDKLGDRRGVVMDLLGVIDERLCLAPASSRVKYHNCFPGGLVDHSLRVLANAFRLSKAFGWKVPRDSLILVCLFHDLGKVGDLDGDMYLSEESGWHRDKLGQLYRYNEEIQFMTHADRSIFLLQHFGVKLSRDEWLAIRLHDGQHVDENKSYSMKEPGLAIIVSLADLIATKQEKGELE
jgi:hypothetical protein